MQGLGGEGKDSVSVCPLLAVGSRVEMGWSRFCMGLNYGHPCSISSGGCGIPRLLLDFMVSFLITKEREI